jgi:putative Mn2+ efflux pump MntP
VKATSTEENNQVIQNSYDAPGRRDTDALSASMQKGDPQEQDRRVLRTIIFIMSTGLVMTAAGPFAIFLGWHHFWLHLSLAIWIGFTLLFFVGVLRFTSELGL